MQFNYSGPRMRGSSTTFQQWGITPLSSNQYWAPNDVIKIMGNISEGLVDFYRSHIQFQIEVTPQIQPIGLVQVDSSAQSFINQTVLLSNQVEIERIQDYDTLASVLTDIGFSEFVCQSRQGQGLGFTNIPTNIPSVQAKNHTSQVSTALPWIKSNMYAMVQFGNSGGFSPVLAPMYTGAPYHQWIGNDPTQNELLTATFQPGISGGTYQSQTNWLSFPPDPTPNTGQLDVYTNATGRAMGVRSEYLLLPQMSGYPDSPTSIPVTAPQVLNQSWLYSNMLSSGFNPKNPYQINYSQTAPSMSGFNILNNSTGTCGISGYTKPIAPQYCRGNNEPVISATIPQIQMIEGKILPSPVPLSKKTFRMPLMSAVCGILIPPDQFQLIPAQSLKNILLQITLNPYAMFTGGYSDIHQFDSVGMQTQNMQKRNWKINSFQWVWHLYTFNSSEVAASIKEKLYKGIVISSNFWQLSAQYQLPNGSYVRNTFQIPTNVQSLAEVLVLFLSNQYQTKTFCRKQFRLSNNITSMQIKANGQYYPLQPIQGNAGNPQTVDTSGDNWNFYELILLSNNFLFNTNVPMPKINQKNFAVNGRIYDTNAQGTYMDQTLYNTLQSGGNSLGTIINGLQSMNTKINPHTALGQSWFHQNRYIGKGLFTYSFQPYGHSKGLINGLDTRGYRQFDITFNNSPNNIFASDETLYIYTRSNVVVRYTQNGIQVLGA